VDSLQDRVLLTLRDRRHAVVPGQGPWRGPARRVDARHTRSATSDAVPGPNDSRGWTWPGGATCRSPLCTQVRHWRLARHRTPGLIPSAGAASARSSCRATGVILIRNALLLAHVCTNNPSQFCQSDRKSTSSTRNQSTEPTVTLLLGREGAQLRRTRSPAVVDTCVVSGVYQLLGAEACKVKVTTPPRA